jgi:hypothetical protein
VIPITVDDLAANGLLEAAPPSASAREEPPQACWERSVETLRARKDDISGLAIASDERIEAYLLYETPEANPPAFAPGSGRELRRETGIVSLRSLVDDDGGGRLGQLFAQLRARGMKTFRFPKVHPAEFSRERLETLGFSPGGAYRLYATKPRPD